MGQRQNETVEEVPTGDNINALAPKGQRNVTPYALPKGASAYPASLSESKGAPSGQRDSEGPLGIYCRSCPIRGISSPFGPLGPGGQEKEDSPFGATTKGVTLLPLRGKDTKGSLPFVSFASAKPNRRGAKQRLPRRGPLGIYCEMPLNGALWAYIARESQRGLPRCRRGCYPFGASGPPGFGLKVQRGRAKSLRCFRGLR